MAYKGYKLTQRMLEKIIAYAKNSLYRSNAKNASGYSFTLYKNNKGKLEWQGGYVRGEDFDGEDFRYNFETGELFLNPESYRDRSITPA